MKKSIKKQRMGLALLIATCSLLLVTCASTGKANPDEVSLNTAIREAASLMETRLNAGTRVALVNFTSPSQVFSEYVLDQLSGVLVNNGKLIVVDRANLDRIRQELGFNASGEVSDASAQEIGRMLGAQAVVTGTYTVIGDLQHAMFKTIVTETAAIVVQHNADIAQDRRIQALLAQGGGSRGVNYGTTSARNQSGASSTASGRQTTTTPTTPTQTTYRVGDTGPAGGLIFYDKGNSIGGWRYLEAAPASTERTLAWGRVPNMDDFARTLQGDDTHKLGKGLDNTRAIMAFARENGGGFGWAAQYCDTLEVNGFDDWFLPSWDELSYMHGNLYLRELGDFKPNIYLSSNIWNGSYNHNIVFFIDFTVGKVASTNYRGGYLDVGLRHLVRAARRF